MKWYNLEKIYKEVKMKYKGQYERLNLPAYIKFGIEI